MAETKKVAKASSRAGSAAADEALPSREEAVAAFSSALAPGLERARSRLSALADRPPQLLHVEGGELNERVGLALWWAALLNCTNTEEAGALQPEPCLACSACLRIGAGLFADLVILDGREGNIKIDQVRELRPLLGEAPRFGRKRVVVVLEAQALGVEAANSLLKSLEEPCPDSCFLFTMPQRERLLPTLVSRGWVLTLPWPESVASSAGICPGLGISPCGVYGFRPGLVRADLRQGSCGCCSCSEYCSCRAEGPGGKADREGKFRAGQGARTCAGESGARCG